MNDHEDVDEIVRPRLPESVGSRRVIVVLRSRNPVQLDAVVDVLVEEGFEAIELALTTPDALSMLRRLGQRLGSKVSLGAGTVTTADRAAAAIDAGAGYLLAPTLAPEACAVATGQGVPFVPGALTPTEALAGWESGAAAVKLFPASLLGPDVVPALRAPMPELQFIPTGGIDAPAAARWLSRGVLAVGVGGPLVGDALEGGDLEALRSRARALADCIAEAHAPAAASTARPNGSTQ